MTITTGKHFVVFPMQMWGHTRTMCTLVARMAKLRNVTITFFIISGFYDRVMAEISREFLPGEEYLSARIRVVALQHNKSVAITKDVEAAFEAAYVKMCNGEPLTCAKTGKEIPVHPMRVSVAIIDMFIPDAFEAVRKHTPDTVKVFVWVPVATHSFFFYWAEDHVDSVEASAAQRGISFEEAAREGRDYNEPLARADTNIFPVLSRPCPPRHPLLAASPAVPPPAAVPAVVPPFLLPRQPRGLQTSHQTPYVC
ncbi:hypothetical protein BD309DRAFT_1021029 [Dichomitus squalens]|nr:hypothetical protein BD309DRAFT_1021029 [Dichomitus squalens]